MGRNKNKDIVIAIRVHNQLAYVKLAVDSIRFFAGNSSEIILLSEEKKTEIEIWAREQNLTYLYNEGNNCVAELMNRVLSICESRNVLFMDDSCLVLPDTVSKLLECLNENIDIGAVGSVSNEFENYQKCGSYMKYEDALNNVSESKRSAKQVLFVEPYFFILSGKVICELGKFDERFVDISYVVKDYFLRLILEGWKIQVCEESFVWSLGIDRNINSVDERRMEEKWGMRYFNTMYNFNLLELIEEEQNNYFRVLEIGCDCGATLLEIKNRYPNAEVYGSDINEEAVKVANSVVNATVNNIEEFALQYEKEYFDYIILGDVLEHLREPLKVIAYCRSLLKKDGCILASFLI